MPYNPQTEQALLGAMLLTADAITAARDVVTPESFYVPAHAHICAAVFDLFDAGQPADPMTVAEKMRRADLLEVIGGPSLLTDLVAATPFTGNAKHYATDVAQLASLRRAIALAADIKDAAYRLDVERVDTLLQTGIGGAAGPVDARFVEAVEAELGIPMPQALSVAERVGDRYRSELVTGLARRIARDEQLARDADLGAIVAVTGVEMLARPRPERKRLLGDLVMVGHNVTITARYKVGKSTLVENITAACVTGRPFLGRYEVPRPLRVALLNYELDVDDMELRLRRMKLDAEALERLLILNLRGHRLPLTTPAGRDWLVNALRQHAADVVHVDPFGAAYASSGGVSENDNAEVRRFLTALDEIKRLAGCPSLFMPVHTGRAEQVDGDERGRGATVLDDWADIRMIMTKDKDHGRYLRTEGRAWDLPESALGFDEATGRLMLASTDLGKDRHKARDEVLLAAAVAAVRANPGASTRDLRDVLPSFAVNSNDEKDKAISLAIAARAIHWHAGARNAHLHYIGEPHDPDPCPEGWTQ